MAKRTPDKKKTSRVTLPDIGKKETFEFSRRETGNPPAINRATPVQNKAKKTAPSGSSKPKPAAKKPTPPAVRTERVSMMPRKGMSIESGPKMPSVNMPASKTSTSTPGGRTQPPKKQPPSTSKVGFKAPKGGSKKACGPGRKKASCPSGAPQRKRR